MVVVVGGRCVVVVVRRVRRVGEGVEDPRYHPTAPSINLRTRPEPPNTLEEVSLDGESDHEEFVRSAHYRDASQPQQHARAKAQRMPQWSAVGTPRLIGRGFPRPPGVPLPKIAEDGTGPLDLGLEPPRKRQKGDGDGRGRPGRPGRGEEKGEKSDELTLAQALRLRVESKPWDEGEGIGSSSMRYACVHACALLLPCLPACHRHRMRTPTPLPLSLSPPLHTQVMKFGSKDEDSLTKATKRSWGSLTARINKFQKEGKLPERVIPPSEEVQAKAAKAAAAAAPPPKFSASGRPVASSSVSALVSMPGGVEGGGKKRGGRRREPYITCRR